MPIHLPITTAVLMTLVAPVASAAPTSEQSPSPELVTVLAIDIEDRMPMGAGASFPPDVGQLVLWMRVTGREGQALHHVWFHGDQEVADVSLPIGGSPWRTWSRKVIRPDMTGTWRVEVRDAAGTVLERVDFTVE